MKIKIKGEMTLDSLRQCIFEQLHSLEDRYAIRHTNDVTLYLNLTNGFGDTLVCKDADGKAVQNLVAAVRIYPQRPVLICFEGAGDDTFYHN